MLTKLKGFIGISLLILAITVTAFSGWRLVGLKQRAAESSKREELKRNARYAASLIDPGLAKMLTFTPLDQGTLAFEKISGQLKAFLSGIEARGIYTMAPRAGYLIFGPETYESDDPQASPPGTVYEEPYTWDLEIFVTGEEYVYGPATDEYGTFVTAIAPVKNPATGEVIAAVGIDVPAGLWRSTVMKTSREPIIAFLFLLLIFLLGIVAVYQYAKRIHLGHANFSPWIIVPVAVVMAVVTALFAAHEYDQALGSLTKEIGSLKDIAGTKWTDILDVQAKRLKARAYEIMSNEEIFRAWQDGNVRALYEKSEPIFEVLSGESAVTHFSFIDDDRSCFLRVHDLSRRADIIDRTTLHFAAHTWKEVQGFEPGNGGSFVFRYVVPWYREGSIFGYLELGTEIKHLKETFMDFFGVDMMTIVKKDRSEKEKTGKEKSRQADGWSDLDDYVVIDRGSEEIPEKIKEKIKNHDVFNRRDIFRIDDNGKVLFAGVIPIHSVMGEESAVVVFIQDRTEDIERIKGTIFFNVCVAFSILFGVVSLLWYVTNKVEDSLRGAFEELKISEGRMAVTFDSMGDAVIATDVSGCVTRMNPVAEKLTGWAFSDARGKHLSHVFRIINAKTGNVLPDLARKVLDGGETIGLANHTVLVSRDGTEYQIADSAAPIKDGAGRISGIVVVFHDVTEQYLVREELNRIRERLSIATQGIGIGVWDYQVDGDLLEWDDVMFELFDVSRKNFRGTFHDFAECVLPEKLPKVEREFRDLVERGKDFNIEFPIAARGGKVKYIGAAATAVCDENGRVVRVVGVNYDITERYERQEKIRQLSKAVEQSPVCVVITDITGRIEYVNPKFVELTGYGADDVLGENPRILKSGEQGIEVYRDLWESITSGKNWKGEFHNKKKSGELYWERAAISPLRGEDGKITHFIGIKEDITEQKRFEEELKASHENIKKILEGMPLGVVIINRDRKILWANEKMVGMIGHSSNEDVFGWDCSDFFCREGQEECPFFAGGEAVIEDYEGTVRSVNGVETPVIKTVKTFELEGQEVLLETFVDISDLKMFQEKIKQSEEKYRTLIENMPGIVFRCINDKKWTMIFLSEEIYRMTGYSASDFIGNAKRTYASIISEEDRERVYEQINKRVSEEKPYDIEYRIKCVDGKVLWVKEKGRVILDKERGITWLDGVIFDITIRKKAEEELEQAIAMQMEFTSTVSHELRTPLTAIKSGVSIVLDGIAGEVNPDQKDFLSTVNRNVDRLTRLINDVLDFQRLKSGKEKFVMDLADINGVIEETYEDMLPAAREKGLDLSLSLERTIPKIVFDKDAVTRVLVNLLNNAFKFTSRGSVVVSTKAKPEENVVLVTVADTGKGIKEQDMPRLFEDFIQLDTGKDRQTGGTGLGLAICKKLIAHHGGRIWAESEFGKGTKFHFVLPIEERRGSYGAQDTGRG